MTRFLSLSSFVLFIILGGSTAKAQCGCANCPVQLPDDLNTTFQAFIEVENLGNNTLGVDNMLQQVCIDIIHDWIGDLDVSLIAPDSTVIVLFADGNSDSSLGGSENCPCGNSADDLDVCFTLPGASANAAFGTTAAGPCSDAAYFDPCNGGTSCYSGTWETWDQGCLGGSGLADINAAGGTVSGLWGLEINDNAGLNQGVLNDIQLVFTTEPDDCQSAPCWADAGTVTTSNGTNAIVLCTGDSFSLTSPCQGPEMPTAVSTDLTLCFGECESCY